MADFLELAELLCIDALHRTESCGGAFPRWRARPRTAKRCATTSICLRRRLAIRRRRQAPQLRKEPLDFDNVHLAVRSYK